MSILQPCLPFYGGHVSGKNVVFRGRQVLKRFLMAGIVLMPMLSFGQLRPDSLLIKGGVIQSVNLRDTVPLIRTDSAAGRLAAAGKHGDTTKKRGHTPRGATIRSAILPGWGQIYNRKYWKLPLVYGALGITGYVFFDNISFYKDIRFAYLVTLNKETDKLDQVNPRLRPIVEAGDLASLRANRNAFRRNIDYSVLFFIFFWGLNVLDATVDGHLRGFDVSDDLSLKIKPTLNYNSVGMGLVLDIHKGKPKLLLPAN